MTEHAARAAISRMNMREVLVAPHYTTLANDLHMMARVEPERGNADFLARRSEMCAAFGLAQVEQRKPFAYSQGLAVIPVHGTLINRFGASWGYVTGYNFIRSQLQAALADEDVQGIVLDVNSFGGEAAGCFELAAEIRAAREQKPILAVIDSNGYSAGYAIPSAASKIVVTPSGGVGSIGVVTMHVDMSKMYEDWGIKVTLIYESEHKVDGNPFEALSADVKADIQKSIHKSYEAFVALVAENRGMDAQKVRDTKSRSYRAEDALSVGLIDAIATPQSAGLAFLSELSGSTMQQQQGVSTMSKTNEPGDTNASQANTEAITAAATKARTEERARIAGIIGSEEAKGRDNLANHLAMQTDMSVEAARELLKAAPQEAAAPATTSNAGNPFTAAMDATKNPNVGANTDASGQEANEDPVKRILSAQAAVTGVKH